MMDAAHLNFMRRMVMRFALPAALLAGCAGQQLHQEGMALMAEGRAEEGLGKLAEASRAAPDNVSYRADLARSREQTVSRLLAAADSERAAGRPAVAQAVYERALALHPGNSRAVLGLEMLQMDGRHDAALNGAEALLKKRDTDGALSAVKQVLLENPKNGRAQRLQRKINEQVARETLAEPSLKAKFTKPVTLQFRDANLKMVFEALSRTSGINVLLDRDVKPDLKTSIFVKDVSVEDTINLILLQNQLEKKVISDNTVFIYPGTAAKLKEYQDLKIRSFHLTNADPKQMLTMIKTLLKTKDIFIHEKTNSIVMRDTPDAIRLAEKMVADQDIDQAEVMLEVEVLEVSTARLSELGIKWPGSLTLSTPASADTLGAIAGTERQRPSGNPLERDAQPEAGRWRHQRPGQPAHPGAQPREGKDHDRQPGAGDHQCGDAGLHRYAGRHRQRAVPGRRPEAGRGTRHPSGQRGGDQGGAGCQFHHQGSAQRAIGHAGL